MTRLETKLQDLKAAKKKGLFIYIMAGAPDRETTLAAVKAAERAGADVIELGFPFSDPLADGPVIQEAGIKALRNGMTLAKVAELVREIHTFTDLPLVGMGYINHILKYGMETFATDFKAAGLDGVILPDVPHEESASLRTILEKSGMHLIEFVTPGTTTARVRETCASASGFIYAVSVNGVTGVQEIDYSVIGKVAELVREETKVPLAVGFGIGSPAVAAAAKAEAVIVGSAVVRRVLDDDLAGAETFIRSLREALDGAYGMREVRA